MAALHIIRVKQENTHILVPVLETISEATTLLLEDNAQEYRLQQDLKAATEDVIAMSQTLQRDHLLRNKAYLPITQRQMKQGWRYLRRLVREGPETELDLEATVQQVGRQGFLLKPLLKAPRQNKTRLIFLIDQEGSMRPFQTLAEQLAQTAKVAGRLGTTDIYYFHNCPYQHLYSDPIFLEGITFKIFLKQISAPQTVALIVSDAGAARGGNNPERVALTQHFLATLKPKIRQVVWLNPLPRNRWDGTTASKIALHVPMFESSHSDVLNAISTLKSSYIG